MQISLNASVKNADFCSCKLLNMLMCEIGFLLEIKRCGLEKYSFLLNFEESFFVAFTAVIV